jgi:hypothetical protein
MSLRRLRRAIQSNQVSFPSQVPQFQGESRADIQWRLVNLYFVGNWSCARLGSRYGITGRRTSQILTGWVQHALVSGYLQEIPPARGRQLPPANRDVDSPAVRARLRPEETAAPDLTVASSATLL